MAEASNRPEPAVLKRKGFQVCQGIFSVLGVDRVEGSRLKELFDPESLRLKRDQKAARESAKELFKKDFFVAQLKHYGIGFASTANVSQLRDLLERAVRENRVSPRHTILSALLLHTCLEFPLKLCFLV